MARAHSSRLCAAGGEQGLARKAELGKDDVGEEGMLQEQPFELPVPGTSSMPLRIAVAGRLSRILPAVDLRRARAPRVRPREGEHQLVLPLPRKAADAKDLSLAQIE